MSYKNGINSHKALVVKHKDLIHYDHKTIALNQIKSKTFINNDYKYIKYQGKYYTGKGSKSYSGASTLVWFDTEVTILLLNQKEINIISDFYSNNDEIQKSLKPDFSNASFDNKIKNILSLYCEDLRIDFYESGILMSKLVNELLIPNWINFKNNKLTQNCIPLTLKSVLNK